MFRIYIKALYFLLSMDYIKRKERHENKERNVKIGQRKSVALQKLKLLEGKK